jgi:hypothetical protein
VRYKCVYWCWKELNHRNARCNNKSEVTLIAFIFDVTCIWKYYKSVKIHVSVDIESGRYNRVGVVTGLRVERRVTVVRFSGRATNFASTAPKPALGPNQPQNPKISVVFFLDVKQPRCKAGSSTASLPAITNERSFASTPPK